jgi:hypothetical protein
VNSADKWIHVFSKIEESTASIVCLQETKKEDMDMNFIKSTAPHRFDKFAFVPSDGDSGGLLIIWVSNLFKGQVILSECFGIAVHFKSTLGPDNFNLVNIYGPCEGIPRENFIAWLYHLDILDEDLWLLVGDFNFYWFSDNLNKAGANITDMATFNEVISYLGSIELPIKGRAFTWSNMQIDPLLEQVDWFFASSSWTIKYPKTLVNPLARHTSDHVPCVISIDTFIPKAQVFCFENHCIKMPGFMEVVQNIWSINCLGDSAKCISSKFKLLRKGLKIWSTSISVINKIIDNSNSTILMIDGLEESRVLYISEWNFRSIVKARLHHLLLCKRAYWKSGCTAHWAKLGNENTSYFHSMATSSIDDNFDFSKYIHLRPGLSDLSIPFTHEEIDTLVQQLATDKAPGPDGFTGLFIKICWPIIKTDFYRICQEFWNGSINLQSINDAFITLITQNKFSRGSK